MPETRVNKGSPNTFYGMSVYKSFRAPTRRCPVYKGFSLSTSCTWGNVHPARMALNLRYGLPSSAIP